MNNVKTAYFRCDASSDVGLGHFMRCMTLATALHQQGWQTNFLTTLDTDYDFANIDQSRFKILSADNIPLEADLAVIDHYELDRNFHTSCRQWAKRIMVIDDLANRDYDCDILLDQTYGRDGEDYKKHVPDHCKILCGHDYILLRQDFMGLRSIAEKKRASIERVENILINFGSTNPDGIIQTSLKAVSDFTDRKLDINIVCSSIAEDLEVVTALARHISDQTEHDVKLHVDVTNMADFMLEADMAIGAGGTTSWERACLGLPTLLIEVSKDQNLVSKNLEKQGAVRYLGHLKAVSEGDIDKAFESMRDNGQLLRQMSEKAFKISDGQGVARVLKEINT